MELRDVKKKYTEFYNQCKKAGTIVPNLEVKPIIDYQIFYFDFDFYVEMSKRSDKENIKNYSDILKEPQNYFPASNMSICITGDWGELLVAHYISLPNHKDKYTYFAEDEKSGTIRTMEQKSKFVSNLLQALLFSLNDKKTLMGTDSVGMRRKSGQSEIVPIVYVSSKKYIKSTLTIKGEPIDWQHSWEVIGHWRICASIGKDRDGEYNQVGRTWVNPAIRGKGELVKKIRIVK